MASEWPPAPPDGYRLHDPEYDQPWYVTVFLFCWIISAFVGVPALVIGVHGLDTAVAIVREVLQPDSAGEWVVYLGWTAATLGLLFGGHEALHALVGRWVGLRTTFRFQYNHPLSWSPEVVTYGGFQSRGDSLIIVLAPLVVLTPVSIVVLVWSQHLWLIAAAAILAPRQLRRCGWRPRVSRDALASTRWRASVSRQ